MAKDGGRSRCRKSPGYVGYKMRRKGIVFCILRHEVIVGRDRRVEGKVEKIKTSGKKKKKTINMIVHINGKKGRPQGNPK